MTSMAQAKTDYPPLPQPEPGLTPEKLLARAAELRPILRAEQDESDWRGHYSQKVHKALLEGGFYRILQPRLFGGYEFGPKVFIQAIIEIARGHPGAGWCFALGASHGYLLASHWPEEVQRELFGPDGEFRSAAVGVPSGKLTPVEGGYKVTGTWPFASGSPYSTHFMGSSFIAGENGQMRRVMLVTPRETIEILDDWGKDQYFGMQASGSNTVKLTDVFVPERYVIETKFDSGTQALQNGTIGTRLHGNPVYLGIIFGWFNTEFAAILTGAARAALDEFKELALTKSQLVNPSAKLFQEPFVQEAFGRAHGLADAAETVTLACVDLYTEQCRAFIEDGTPITTKDTMKVWGMASQAAEMAGDAVEILFHQSGGSTGRRGKKLQRYFKDIETYRLHPQSQPFGRAARGQIEFGMEDVSMFARITKPPRG